MERYIIDSDTWIELFHGRHGIPEHINKLNIQQLCVSEVTIAELLFGALNSSNYEKHKKEPEWLQNNITVFPISEVLKDYATLRYELKKKGIIIGNFDLLIGATALHYGLTVVTNNYRHFKDMPNVKVENWWKE